MSSKAGRQRRIAFCEQSYQRENWNRYLISDPYFATLAYEKWQEIRGTLIEDMIKAGGKIDTLQETYRTASEANDASCHQQSTYRESSGHLLIESIPVTELPIIRVVYKQSETYDDAALRGNKEPDPCVGQTNYKPDADQNFRSQTWMKRNGIIRMYAEFMKRMDDWLK